jgi:hypothetical protein
MADSRFRFTRMFPFDGGDGRLLAFFGFVDTETGLEYSDFMLKEGQYGIYVESPGKPGKNDKWYNFVRPAWDVENEAKDEYGAAFFEELTEAANAEYERIKEEGGSNGGGGGGRGRGGNSGGGGRRASGGNGGGRKSSGGGRASGGAARKSSGEAPARRSSGRGPMPPSVPDNDGPFDTDDDDLPF